MVKCSHCLLYVFCVTLVFSNYYFLFQIVINYLLLRILNNYFFSNYLFVLMYLFLLFLLVIDLFVITMPYWLPIFSCRFITIFSIVNNRVYARLNSVLPVI